MLWLYRLISPFVADFVDWVVGSRYAKLIAWLIAVALMTGAIWLVGRLMRWW